MKKKIPTTDKKKAGATEPKLIPRLDRNLAVTKFRSGGMGNDGEMFTCRLTLDGREIARVIQSGDGGPNCYEFKDGATQREYEEWAKKVTGGNYDPLDRVVAFLRGVNQLNKEAASFGKKGYEGAILILAEPTLLDEGEEPNPFGGFFDRDFFRPLAKLSDAEQVAREEGALFYMVSEPLPPGAVADRASAEKEEANKQAKKWNAKDPTVIAALLIKKDLDDPGRIHPVRSKEDAERLIREHGTALYALSDFLPEPSEEQVRAFHVGRLNEQLREWRGRRPDYVAAVMFKTEKGNLMVASASRHPAAIKALMGRHKAVDEHYYISDPLPDAKDNPNAAAVQELLGRVGRGRKGGRGKGRR